MITMHWLYLLAGALFAVFAILSAMDHSHSKRFGNAAFWGLMALSLLAGDLIGDFGNGLLVLGLAGLAGFGFIGRKAYNLGIFLGKLLDSVHYGSFRLVLIIIRVLLAIL